jgi:hypothetical protein
MSFRPARPPPARPSFGARSLAALHLSLGVMGGFLVAVLFLVGFAGGRLFLEQHFEEMRVVAYVAWALGLAAFAAAPALLARDLGIASAFQLRRLRATVSDAGGRGLLRAFSVGIACNALVLAASPLGLVLGDDYGWDVFRAHLVLSTLVVVLGSMGALVRLRGLLEELAAVPAPSRVSRSVSAGF